MERVANACSIHHQWLLMKLNHSTMESTLLSLLPCPCRCGVSFSLLH